MSDFKDYMRKHGRLFLLSFVTAVLCYGFLSLSGNIRIDTEELINTPGTTVGWLRIGRYGLVLLKRLLGLSTHHVLLSGLLFLLFFILGSNLILFLFYHISGRDEKICYPVFVLLYGTSSIWCYQVYFSLQQAEISFAMLLLAAAAFLAMYGCFEVKGKRGLVCCVISAALLIIGFGVYQALVMYYAAVCMAAFLLYLWRKDFVSITAGQPDAISTMAQEREARRLLGGIGKLLFWFSVSYGIYMWIASTWFMSTGDYLTGQRGWGRLTVIGCIKNILNTVKRMVLCRGSEYFSFYPIGAILTVIAVLCICRKKYRTHTLKCILTLFTAAGLLLSPFLMTIYMGEFIVTRAQFALPFAAAFLGMFGLWQLSGGKFGRKIQIFGRAAVFLVTLVQFAYCMQLAYTDHVRYAEDAAFSEEVLTKLDAVCGEEWKEMPVIFVGRRIPKLARGCVRTEMYGWSFYEWDYNPKTPTGATHRIIGFLNAYAAAGMTEDSTGEMNDAAVEYARTMPKFPAEGSIFLAKDFIVVHLSD